VGKSGALKNKSGDISETCRPTDRGKVTMGAYRNLLTLFPTASSPTPYGPLLPKIGFAPHPKLQSLLSQERVKLRTSNLAKTITPSIRTKPMKKFGEKRAWAYQGTSQIFRVPPINSGTGKATNFKFGQYIYSVHPNKSP